MARDYMPYVIIGGGLVGLYLFRDQIKKLFSGAKDITEGAGDVVGAAGDVAQTVGDVAQDSADAIQWAVYENPFSLFNKDNVAAGKNFIQDAATTVKKGLGYIWDNPFNILNPSGFMEFSKYDTTTMNAIPYNPTGMGGTINAYQSNAFTPLTSSNISSVGVQKLPVTTNENKTSSGIRLTPLSSINSSLQGYTITKTPVVTPIKDINAGLKSLQIKKIK